MREGSDCEELEPVSLVNCRFKSKKVVAALPEELRVSEERAGTCARDRPSGMGND